MAETDISTDFTIAAGVTYSAVFGDADPDNKLFVLYNPSHVTPAPSFTNNGVISFTAAQMANIAAIYVDTSDFWRGSTILNTGTLTVSDPAGYVHAVWASSWSPDLVNTGTIEVVGGGQAIGFESWDNDTPLVNNSGLIKATSVSSAYGLYMPGGAKIINSGDIIAISTGDTPYDDPYAISLPNGGVDILNTGTIKALNPANPYATAIAYFTSVMTPGSGGIVNHGLIEGSAYAIRAIDGGNSFASGGAYIDNEGDLKGAVYTGEANDTLLNTGHIVGAVDFGAGTDTYDGRGGQITGVIFGGDGDDHLLGGNGGEIFSGGAGSDTLSGGAGADIALYAGLAKGYTLGLSGGAGTVAGGPEGGTDSLSGIDTLIFQDGALTFDENNAAAVVMRMYDTALGRLPDTLGWQYWTHTYESGQITLTNLAQNFANSTEYLVHVAGMTNRQIVDYMYVNTLDRAPDQAGEDTWTAYLDAGHGLWELVLQFSESAEHKALTAGVVAQGLWDGDAAYQATEFMYEAAFGRLPDAGGLVTWANALKGGMSLYDMAVAFTSSGEFYNNTHLMTHRELVDYMYQTALHRAPDAGGEAAWTAYLDGGGSPADLLLQFQQSQELQLANAAYIDHGNGFI